MLAVLAAPVLGTLAAVGWWVFAARVRGTFRWAIPVLVLTTATSVILVALA